MTEHKWQHWIPRAYLSAWCDPDTPEDQEPYVWSFPRDGGAGRRRAPKNMFAETDMYTIKLEDGTTWKQANKDDHYKGPGLDHLGVAVFNAGLFGYKMRIQGTQEFYVNQVKSR